MKKVGVAYLPLHYGKAPRWLFTRMVKLAGEIAAAVVEEYGSDDSIQSAYEGCFWNRFP